MTTRIKSLLLGISIAALAANVFAQTDVNELKARAEAGDKTSMRRLAESYYLDHNFSQAAHWYEKAAKKGDMASQTILGLMYQKGYGVEKNSATAYKLWGFAAAQNDPSAQNDLGNLFFEGEGVKQDYAQAAYWYRGAAHRGHVQAQQQLGMMYFDGKGVEKDIRQAYYLTKLAALQGDDDAAAMLKRIAPNLTVDQIREADTKADDWLKSGKKIWQE